jgi:signal transduction histidine kinase
MDCRTIVRSAARRLRAPAAWGAIAAFQAVWLGTRILSGVPWTQVGRWETFLPALFLLGHLVLSPAPWQWTGDRRPAAPLLRGGGQALAWSAAWVALLLWGVQDVIKPFRPRRPASAAQVLALKQPPPPPARSEALAMQPPPPQGDIPPPPPGPSQEMNLLLLNLPFGLVLGWFLAGKERAESAEEALRARERQARALALQAQLHPHALYNVLGGLTELVHEDPDATEKGLIDLVELLRMLTRQGSAPSLPLAQERALLKRYLTIESLRLGDRLQVRWDWPEWADAVPLPPFFLQPLVENAVKHGIAASPQGGEVRIGVSRQGQDLVLRVANTGAPYHPEAAEGTGLSNLRERLALLSHLDGSLVIRGEAGRTLAEIRLRNTMSACHP